MSEQTTNKGGAFLPLLGNVVLSVLGMTIALGLVEILMRAFPNSVPAEVRVNPPARRVGAFIDETYDLKQSDGDLHHYMRGHIKPLAPEQDQVVAHVHMITDAHGFRNSPPEKVTYDIVVLGDSFTRASGVASPWPHRLAEHTGSDVLNLGDVGFGPQDELKVLQEYGIKKEPEWVIMAYFEGNDSYDAASYEQANPFILFRLGRFLLGRGVEARHDRGLESTQAIPIPTHRYPINATINNKVLEMVFFSSYISWLSLSGETIEASQNYRLVQETILQAQELSESEGADFLLVYLPYLDDAGIVARVFTDLPGLGLDEAGFIEFTSEPATPELVRQHMDDQARVLADLAAQHNILYLDLTPIFQEVGGAGVELYYPYDTHWNQSGHDLAAETIHKYIEDVRSRAASGNPSHSK